MGTPNNTETPLGNTAQDFGKIVDEMWVLNATYLVFYMQAGFCMLEAGIVRAKNAKSIIVKNIIDTSVGTLMFWAVGFGIAFGTSEHGNNGFIGSGNFFLLDYNRFSFWAFQWAFSATATNIVSGSMAERTHVTACIIYTFAMSAVIYPIYAHWVWTEEGWLRHIGKNGLVDYAGASVVHMIGGCVGMVGAYIVGPRLGRFDAAGRANPMPGHSITLCTLGAFILWYGFYGFNTGSTQGAVDGKIHLAAKIAVSTTICATGSCTTTLFVLRYTTSKYDISSAMNGLLSGLVASSACCGVIEPWSAFVIGMISSVVYLSFSRLLLYLQIDDPLDSAPIHLGAGAWGLISVGIFASDKGMRALHPGTDVFGVLYGGGWQQLGVQVLGLVVVLVWATVTSGILFLILKRFHILRIDAASELVGLDNVDFGGSAYPNFQQI